MEIPLSIEQQVRLKFQIHYPDKILWDLKISPAQRNLKFLYAQDYLYCTFCKVAVLADITHCPKCKRAMRVSTRKKKSQRKLGAVAIR